MLVVVQPSESENDDDFMHSLYLKSSALQDSSTKLRTFKDDTLTLSKGTNSGLSGMPSALGYRLREIENPFETCVTTLPVTVHYF